MNKKITKHYALYINNRFICEDTFEINPWKRIWGADIWLNGWPMMKLWWIANVATTLLLIGLLK